MTSLQCSNCRFPLAGGDTFCGNCGAPSAPPTHRAPALGARARTNAARAAPQRPVLPGKFFGHPPSGRPANPPDNATRYLCAAAYLDPAYANTVIGELVASHRAVVPMCGIDLGLIIRHCLHARKMQLVRDILLTIFLAGGLYLATLPTIAIMIIAFFLGSLPRVRWERRSIGVKLLIGAGAVIALGSVAALRFALAFLGQASRSTPQLGPLATGGGIVIPVLALVGLTATTLVTYSYVTYRTLGDRLSPGADAARFDRSEERIEARITEVESAQWGNVTLYSGQNPFIGTGNRDRVWSIAIELDRAPSPGSSNNAWSRPGSRGYVPIDPVELHQTIRRRLLRLRDPELPENERVSALMLDDHIVGEGHRRWDSPLIDPTRKMPYSQAGPEAIDALIRHPQAGLRYYQRVSVSDEGQAVWTDQREVIERADQEVAVSAFIYVAVEGRMFYLEFVATILPPILRRYHMIDLLPKITSGKFLVKVLLDAASTAFRDMIRAPVGACATLLRMLTERQSFAEEIASARDYVYGDFGARISVRELAAAPSPHTYTQRLDAAKYTKIIERLVIDTVLDFLVDKGVDASAYRNSAQTVINSGVVISGGTVTGPVAAGQGAVAHAETRTERADAAG